MNAEVLRTSDFARYAAAFILEQGRAAIGARGQFRIALSGGNTPRPVYRELAARAHDHSWERTFVTFGDERCVPPDDAQSNFRMVRESLFLPAAVPEFSIARLRGEIDPQIAAQEYEDQLNVLAVQKGEIVYRHDLILLGMGDDGHTASLFPGTAALDEQARKVVANWVPKFNSWRLTFTLPLIHQARHVLFLVDGTKHPALIDAVLAGDRQYPAALVAGGAAEVTWMIGRPA